MDALTDGLFAIVMTILVLDIHLPPHAHYGDAQELVRAIAALGPQILAYGISFFVLALFWRGLASMRSDGDHIPEKHTGWWIVHLFIMTCVPVTTGIVGAYGNFAPAVWLYAANMILGALTAWGLAMTSPGRHRLHATAIRLALLASSALLSVVLSFFDPANAMWAYLLNAAAPFSTAQWERRHPARPE